MGASSVQHDEVAGQVSSLPAPGLPLQLRTLRGGVVSRERLATTSGPMVLLVVGAACVVLSLTVIWRGDASETAAGFWPPAGASLVAMMVLPVRRWGWVAGGILAPTLVGLVLGMVPLSSAIWFALGNCSEPTIAALLLLRFAASPWFTRDRFLMLFLLVAVVAAPMIGGAVGSIGNVTGGTDRSWSDHWIEWAMGDGLGVLVVTPLLLTYTRRGVVRRTRAEALALAVLVAGASGLAFIDIGANGAALLPYLMLVGLIWAGMRFGTRSAAVAGFAVGLAANVATTHGFGPFSQANRSADIITLQIFLAIALVTSFVIATMASDLSDRDEVQRLLTHQARHDPLTGLPNRVLFAERLEAAVETQRREGSTFAVLVVDLDDFKKINDRYGHPAGDAALVTVAERLRRSTRPQDLVARLGGDEFAILSEALTGPAGALTLAENVVSGLDEAAAADGDQHHLTGSIGGAILHGAEVLTTTDLLHRADIALHHAKRTPHLNVAFFDEALEAHTMRRIDIDEELRGAIERGEMTVVYQPLIDLASGRISEFEALARWTNRRLGAVSPDEFIAVAEDTGLINLIGDWVLEVACQQLALWRACDVAEGSEGMRVAVNVSARQLSDSQFPIRVARTLAMTGVPAGALTLEITETALMDDLEVTEVVLADLDALGVRLSMDDFGTGYSSMSNLRRMPLRALKIDRSFVAGLGQIPEDTAIVESTISLGHSFGLEVVAEGVETRAQRQHLLQLGCDHGQGYLWSRPLDERAAAALLRRTNQASQELDPQSCGDTRADRPTRAIAPVH